MAYRHFLIAMHWHRGQNPNGNVTATIYPPHDYGLPFVAPFRQDIGDDYEVAINKVWGKLYDLVDRYIAFREAKATLEEASRRLNSWNQE
jgi:hypothetical protein